MFDLYSFKMRTCGEKMASVIIAKVIMANNSIRRADVENLNFRGGSTFLVPVCTVPSSMDRTKKYIDQEPPYLMRQIMCTEVEEIKTKSSGAKHHFSRKRAQGVE